MHLSSLSLRGRAAIDTSANCQLLLLWIVCVSWFVDFTDGRKVTDSRYDFPFLGDRYRSSCNASTSRPLEWHWTPYGSNVSEVLTGTGQADSSVKLDYKIVSEGVDRSALTFDTVRTSIAGSYKCQDKDDIDYKLSVEVTVIDPHPICDQRQETSSTVCRFRYAGNEAPDFMWLPLQISSSWNESVSDSSTIGSLHLRKYQNSARRWRCEPQADIGLGERFSPLNYAGLMEENVRLNCSKQSDDTGYWFRSVPLSTDEMLIYHKKMIRNGLFSVYESLPGRCDMLFILSQGTAGRYGCDSVFSTQTAEVIVTESQPTCSWERQGRVVNATCSIGFRGNWQPIIVWSNLTVTVTASDTITIPSQSVTNILILQLSGDPHELHSVTCSVKFRLEDKPQQATAVNIPKSLIDTCTVAIDASGSGTIADKKGVQKLNTAMFFASVNEYEQTESRYRIVLVGDRVEFDCFADTSRPLEWNFKLYGTNDSEVNSSGQADSNDTDAYRIESEDSGHSTLIIDHVLLKHGGRYECKDGDKKYKLTVNLTVFDPNSPCNQDPDSSSIVCPFHHVGNMLPDIDWLTSDNSTFCNEFGNDSSTIGSLRIKGYNNPSRCWLCDDEKRDEHGVGAIFRPLNYAIVEGGRIRLNCSTQNDDTRYWFRKLPLSVDGILIYHNKELKSDLIEIDISVPGRSDLIFILWEKTAGRYGCDSGYATYTAEVILTDSQPTCSGERNGRVMNATCSIGFRGNWPPVIVWSDLTGTVRANDTITIPNQRVTNSLLVLLTGDPHERYPLTCSVKFRLEDKPPETTAKNIPKIDPDKCRVTIKAPEFDGATTATISPASKESTADPGAAAGAIDVDQAQDIDSGPGPDKKGGPKGNEGKHIAEVDNPNSGSGRGQESLVLLEVFLALVAAFVGLGQF